MAKETIGFIGLGIMGTPMSTHLLNAGHPVVVFDIVPDAVQALVSLGAKAGTSCQDVAAQADIVISMVPDSPDVEKVYLPEDGVLAGAKPGTLLIDMSTISPTTAIAVAKAAVVFTTTLSLSWAVTAAIRRLPIGARLLGAEHRAIPRTG